jgi:hypothetical protein
MVEPVTICIAVAVGISTLIGVFSVSKECYKTRFIFSVMDNYDIECPEYPILWDILSFPDHVNNREVKKRDKRRMTSTSEKVQTIISIAEFRQKTGFKRKIESRQKIDLKQKTEESYTFELVHDREDGQTCIRLMCSNNEKLEYFRKRLFVEGIDPSELVLVSCSTK